MWWHTVPRFLFLLGWILILQIVKVEGVGGVFEIRLNSFSNPFGVDDSGVCCNSTVLSGSGSSYSISSSSSTTSRHSVGVDPNECVCSRIYFRICVKHYQVTVDPEPPCYIGETIPKELFTGNNLEIGSPFEYDFKFRWPGSFSLIIEAWQQQELSNQQQFHNPQQQHEERRRNGSARLISRMTHQQFLNVADGWKSKTWTSPRNNQTIGVEYRVRCLTDYYGEGCDRFCRARNDMFGHYQCGDNGEVICLDGWTGVYCEKPTCLTSCHPLHGYCKEPHTCVCHSGWTGKDCSECVPYPGCKHGRCNNSWECECEEGWGGLFCNQDLNYCTNHRPCKNGGTCFNTGPGSFTCSCPEGFSGMDCSVYLNGCEADGTCLNGGTCRENGTASFCLCREGWTGVRCDRQISTCSDTKCNNGGTCVEEMDRVGCLCQPGYGGATCDKLLQHDHQSCPCLSGEPCPDGNCLNCTSCLNGCDGKCGPNGKCIDGKCICNNGYGGEFCTEKVNMCGARPCANGGTCSPLENGKDFQCICAPGFGGSHCTEPCDCLNGRCVNISGAKECLCYPGYGGKRCEYANETVVSQLMKDLHEEQEKFTTEHVVLVVCASIAAPLLAVLAICVVVLLKKRRRDEMRRNDEIARRQNQVNTVQCLGKGSDPHMILNSLDCKRVKISNLDLVNSIGRVSSQTFNSSMCNDFQEQQQRNSMDVATDYPRWVANAVHHSPVIHNNNRVLVEDQKSPQLATTV